MLPLFYRKLGKGKSIILIHGFCETHEIWNDFAENLSRKFEVFIIDLPGFGKSPLPNHSIKIIDIGQIILDWIDEIKIKQPIIIGHSLGGYVCLAMAKLNSQKIAGLGLFQSTIFADSEEKKTNRNKVIEFVKTHGKDPFIDTFVPGLFLNKNHPAISIVDPIARKTTIQTLIAYTEAMRDRESSEEFFRTFDKPVLILGGENDGIISKEAIFQMGQILPKAIISMLRDTGHMAMFEQPSEAQIVVEGFVEAI